MRNSIRPALQWLVAMLVLLTCGCQDGATDPALARADTRAGDIGQKVSAAATQVSGSAQEIVTTAKDGQAATPGAVRPTLDPYWYRIIAGGQLLIGQGDALAGIRKDVDQLRGEVQAGQRQLKDALAAVEAEKAGRVKDNQQWQERLAASNKDWEAKLAKAAGRWEGMFRTISWLAIAAIGISVAVGVLMHDFRISIAGGAGGMAVVVSAMLAGQIQAWLPWVAGGLVALVVLWVLIESLLRGSFRDAIRTTPVQDVADLLRPSDPQRSIQGG